jgi:starvation-inducible DNA-binding protein
MEIGMSQKSKEQIAKALEVFLADTYSVYLKTQNAHWNYVGSGFYAIHLLLEKQYEELAEAVDEIAERVRSLGFFVEASFAMFIKNSTIPSEKITPPSELMEDLVTCHELLICHIRNLCQVAEKEGDGATLDLLGKRLGVHEKNLWMLKNSL